MDGLGGTTANGSRTDLSGPPSRPVVIVPQRQSKSTRDRIVTVRVALFVLILVGMLGGTLGVIIWFDQSSYFIGLNGDAVAIYQGRPGGMLWFKPQLIETSQVHTHDLLRSSIVTLRSGITESSLHAAELVVGRLKNEKEIALAAATTTTTTTSSTSTTSTTTTTTLPIVVTTVPPTIATTTPTTRADATTTSTSPKKSHPTSTTSPTKVTVTTKPQGN
jgi:protein phosphatase